MRVGHICLAILIAVLWGVSFAVMQIGLQHISPLFLCFLRFFLTCFPAIFFIKKPDVSWFLLLGYGLMMFTVKFSLLFFSIAAGMSAGLASLLVQWQVFFTIVLAMFVFHESLARHQWVAIAIALVGLMIIVVHVGGEISVAGFVCVMFSALAWGIANLLSKKVGKINMLGLVVWSSLFAWPPLLLLSFFVDGSHKMMSMLTHFSMVEIASVMYMAYPVTLLGFAIWSFLLNRYRAVTVVPFALLIPIVGILASIILFHETLELWKMAAIILIILGLSVNVVSLKPLHFFKYKKQSSATENN